MLGELLREISLTGRCKLLHICTHKGVLYSTDLGDSMVADRVDSHLMAVSLFIPFHHDSSKATLHLSSGGMAC